MQRLQAQLDGTMNCLATAQQKLEIQSKNYVTFRQSLRQLLNKHGVGSNPGFSDFDIVAEFDSLLSRQPMSEKEAEQRIRAVLDRHYDYPSQKLHYKACADELTAELLKG